MWEDFLLAFALIYGEAEPPKLSYTHERTLSGHLFAWAVAGDLLDENQGWWAARVDMLRETKRQVANFPPLDDHFLWSETEECLKIRKNANRDYQSQLELAQQCLPARNLSEAILQNRAIGEALENLRWAKSKDFRIGRHTKRSSLYELRKIIGDRNYYSGAPIPTVPMWSVPWMN